MLPPVQAARPQRLPSNANFSNSKARLASSSPPPAFSDRRSIQSCGIAACAVAILMGGMGAMTLNPFAARAADNAAAAAPIVGVPKVVDGDTLVVGGTRIRMYGIDAPESKQLCRSAKGATYACGQQSAAALTARINSQTVSCAVKNTDQYGRTVGQCSVNGADLGEYMVGNGFAVSYRQYSKEYVGEEEVAKEARKGIWAGSFTMPSEWRKLSKSAGVEAANGAVGASSSAAVTAASASKPSKISSSTAAATGPAAATGTEDRGEGTKCNIKGNISSNGKFYFVPGARSYATTKIDESKNERWFCSEAEAVAAGWTKGP